MSLLVALAGVAAAVAAPTEADWLAAVRAADPASRDGAFALLAEGSSRRELQSEVEAKTKLNVHFKGQLNDLWFVGKAKKLLKKLSRDLKFVCKDKKKYKCRKKDELCGLCPTGCGERLGQRLRRLRAAVAAVVAVVAVVAAVAVAAAAAVAAATAAAAARRGALLGQFGQRGRVGLLDVRRGGALQLDHRRLRFRSEGERGLGHTRRAQGGELLGGRSLLAHPCRTAGERDSARDSDHPRRVQAVSADVRRPARPAKRPAVAHSRTAHRSTLSGSASTSMPPRPAPATASRGAERRW